MDDRGQTLQDFALGISLFLVTVTFVFGLFPSYLAPFTEGPGSGDQLRSERVGEAIILNHSVPGQPNVLNATQLNRTLSKNQTELRSRYGLSAVADVNVTVRELNDGRVVGHGPGTLSTAERAGRQPAAASGRIVKLTNESVCRPSCRLVVKVW